MKFGDHISRRESLEKDSSSAPETVPVASTGTADAGDHAKVDVRWISFSFMRKCPSTLRPGGDEPTFSLTAIPMQGQTMFSVDNHKNIHQ